LPAVPDLGSAGHDEEKLAFTAFDRTFKEFGLPCAIRINNRLPFASGHAL